MKTSKMQCLTALSLVSSICIGIAFNTKGVALPNDPATATGQVENLSPKDLYTQRCGQCHNLPNPAEKMMNRNEWQRTVNRMLYKDKAINLITLPESVTIVNYLSGFAPKPGDSRIGLTPWSTDSTDVWTSAPTSSNIYNVEDAQTLSKFQQVTSGDRGTAAKWTAVHDRTDSAWKVSQIKPSPSRFGLLVQKGNDIGNVDVKLNFEIIGGHTSPAVGIVFGYKNPQSYYVVRYAQNGNALSVIKIDGPIHTVIQNTELTPLPQTPAVLTSEASMPPSTKPIVAEPITVGPGWHTLRLLVNEGKIRAWIDRNKRINTVDPGYAGGRVGLWAQGDTVAEFKDISVDEYAPLNSPSTASIKQMF